MKGNFATGSVRTMEARRRRRGREWLASLPSVQSDRYLVLLGMLYVLVYDIFWIMPASIGGWLALVGQIVALAFIVPAIVKRPSGFPVSFPVVMLLVLQLWSFFCAVTAERYLGRSVRFGRADSFLILALVPAFVAWRASIVHPPFRRFGMNSLIAVLACSAIVSLGQFLRLPPAMALSRMYTYKSIDNWDGHPGIRAVGLSMQPNHLAFQMVVGVALVCSAVIYRSLTRGEIALAGLFAGAAVFSQSRAGLIPLAVVGVAILFFVVRHDPKQGARVMGGLILALLVAVTIGARRFEYMMMTNSGNDFSAQIREDQTWAQLKPILPKLPFTGIGPSSGLLLGTGPEDKWVPFGRVVESGYLVFQAMYGLPGLLLQIVAIAGSIVAAVLAMSRTRDETQGQLLAVGAVCALCLMVNAYYFNTFDSYLHLPLSCLVAGLAAYAPTVPYAPEGRRRLRPRALPWRARRLAKRLPS